MEEKEFKLTKEGLSPIDSLVDEIENPKEKQEELVEDPIKEPPKSFPQLPKEEMINTGGGISGGRIDRIRKEYEKVKQIVSNYVPSEEEVKKRKLEEFKDRINSNPVTKDYKLINKATYIGLWVFAIVCLILFTINMIWGNINFSNKDFSPIVNNYIEPPNVSVPVSVLNQETNTYPIYNYNNITVNLPNNLTIKYSNSS